MLKSYKSIKGITLVSLVVTIVVLIILAGISISILVGENGVISKAKRAKEEYAQAQSDEEEILKSYENMIDDDTKNKVIEKKMLYDNGVMDSAIGNMQKVSYGSTYPQGTFTNTGNTLKVVKRVDDKSSIYSDWDPLYITSTNAIDFSKYNKLCISFSSMELVTSSTYNGTSFTESTIKYGIATTKSAQADYTKSGTILSPHEPDAIESEAKVYELDISDVNSSGYIKLTMYTGSWQKQRCLFEIDKIWLESVK